MLGVKKPPKCEEHTNATKELDKATKEALSEKDVGQICSCLIFGQY